MFKDPKTIVVKNFVYDGDAPDAFFIVGKKGDTVDTSHAIPLPYPSTENAKKVPFDSDKIPILPKFDGTKDIELHLPEDLTVYDLKWISVYCREFSIDFGNLVFPKFDEPKKKFRQSGTWQH